MKAKISVKTELEVLLPSIPNFVRTGHKDACIPIGDLTDEQIKQIGEMWTDAFMRKARDRRREGIKELNKKLQKLA